MIIQDLPFEKESSSLLDKNGTKILFTYVPILYDVFKEEFTLFEHQFDSLEKSLRAPKIMLHSFLLYILMSRFILFDFQEGIIKSKANIELSIIIHLSCTPNKIYFCTISKIMWTNH